MRNAEPLAMSIAAPRQPLLPRTLVRALHLALIGAGLAGCSVFHRHPPDDAPTLRSLNGRSVEIPQDAGIPPSNEQTIAAYREFLAAAPKAPQRPDAMRRLGDLEMDRADDEAVESKTGNGIPDYRAAVDRYQRYLHDYPDDPHNDRVLYQLARAQEQAGDIDKALATLDTLVQRYPNTQYGDEAEFRRGEMLFTARRYADAEQAYGKVLASDDPTNEFKQRALYMQGWSRFKQGRLDEALTSFFGVLDDALPEDVTEGDLKKMELSRADRELLEDTFRVTGLSLENLQGAASIPPYINSKRRQGYEFVVYRQLGETYLQQERIKDAADTFAAFSRKHPLDAQAPAMQARVIEIYEDGGFDSLALDAKKDYVVQYGGDSEFRRANPEGWDHAKPLLKTYLTALAEHYHASAQHTHAQADVAQAVQWYRRDLATFPDDKDAAQTNFLLAELLYENHQYADAAAEYEKTAYQYPHHAHSADAGYAALLAYAELEKAADAAHRPALQKTRVGSELHFAQAFGDDARVGPVLTNAADTLFTLHDNDQAAGVAKQVLALKPPAADAQRKVAWTVLAHTAFERGAFADAEQAYREAIALTPADDKNRVALVDRLAASVYKQGEQARAAGDLKSAVAAFQRVATESPDANVRASAQYDAAAAMIAMKDWPAAARTLEDFRQRYPQHPLAAEVPAKLAVVYGEQGKSREAAAEYERLAANAKDATVARGALWQAAELYEKAKAPREAAQAYERYLKQYPQPLEPAVEARWRLSQIAKAQGQGAQQLAWMKQVLEADQAGGAARTPRTRTLAAQAALALAEPAFQSYREVRLVEPLAKQLKLKKARMEAVLQAYSVASNYGVAEVTTAATYQTAALYQDFGRALLDSERPKRLSKAEREQYDVMLEEQAYPFEEKAIALHEANVSHAREGVYDDWVKHSYEALAKLQPVRWGKVERSTGGVDAVR
jgi:TolA-binding protein